MTPGDDDEDYLRPLLQGGDQGDLTVNYGTSGLLADFPQPSPDIHVVFTNLKDVYNKYQKKAAGGSEQRIEDAKVVMTATATGQISQIRVFVQRYSEAGKPKNGIGAIELQVVHREASYNPMQFHVDLDSVYKTPDGLLIYELDRVNVEEQNRWQLLVWVCLIDNSHQICNSKPFRLRTKPRPKSRSESSGINGGGFLTPVVEFSASDTESLPSCGSKRPLAPVVDFSASDTESLPSCSSKRPHLDSISVTSPATAGSGSVLHNNEVLTEYLEAQRASIQDLHVRKMICSQNADIAYHLKLGGPRHRQPRLAEGDIIGFFENAGSGNTEIELLSEENSHRCRMAGVISRSAYLYGNAPDTLDEATDTVCVIGLVKVKVAGPVQNGERVYASLEVPGVGVPETQLSLRRRDESSPTLLGQALEAKSAQTIDEINLVECFVSIVLGIQSRQVQSAIDDLQRVFQQQAEFKAKKEKRTKRKGLVWRYSLLLLFVGLLIFLLCEVLVPGSLMRYWLCRRGCQHPVQMVCFHHSVDQYQVITVRGVEFEWHRLKKKLGSKLNFPKYNGTGANFYLNIDLCAYGGLTNSIFEHIPNSLGPDLFAANPKDEHVFVHVEDAGWLEYKPVRFVNCTSH